MEATVFTAIDSNLQSQIKSKYRLWLKSLSTADTKNLSWSRLSILSCTVSSEIYGDLEQTIAARVMSLSVGEDFVSLPKTCLLAIKSDNYNEIQN